MELSNSTEVRFNTQVSADVNKHTATTNEEMVDKFLSTVRASVMEHIKTLRASKLDNASISLSFHGEAITSHEVPATVPVKRMTRNAKVKADKV